MLGKFLSSNLGKVLSTLLVVGVAGSTVSYGTFATFTAETQNLGNTFATGTLVLSNLVNDSVSACLSTGGGSDPGLNNNTNAGCDTALFTFVRKPGDMESATFTVKNDGTLNASALELFTTAGCAPGDAPNQTYKGGGDPCTKIQLTVEETDSGFNNRISCRYGDGPSCVPTTTLTMTTFGASYSSSTPLDLGPLDANTARYFRIALQMDLAADNTFQGRQAKMDFRWRIRQ